MLIWGIADMDGVQWDLASFLASRSKKENKQADTQLFVVIYALQACKAHNFQDATRENVF